VNNERRLLLVGDNPFHGISHLSLERARTRGDEITHAEYAANLVLTSLESGADGFMFSVSGTTLSILQILREKTSKSPVLYAILPYAYEYVRLATQIGMVGLAKKMVKEVVTSRNLSAIVSGFHGVLRMDPAALFKTYLLYELSRIRSSIGKQQNVDSVLLHEIITDMALALNLDWFCKTYINFLGEMGIKPGFETRNFAYLIKKFKEWKLDFTKISIVAPFNKIGFQMSPSKTECESALTEVPECTVIAMSVLAAGYLPLSQSIQYIEGLTNLKGVVVGVSKEKHARETFRLLSHA
jgi:hypothetical protein